MSIAPVRFPAELQSARADILEEYVQNRIAQIVSAFTRRLNHHAPGLTGDVISKSLTEAFAQVPAPEYTVIPLEERDLQLVFRHDCMALGCLDPQCALCQHNPNRRCVVNFDRKYLVSDMLKARCGACIRIELVDRNTGLPIEEDIPDLRLETYILDGNLYDNKFLEGGKIIEGGTEPEDELEACALMLNKKKNTPLLVCGTGGVNDSHGKVIMPMPRGNKVTLPELHVSDSSEAILSGRKPPFRLLVRALLPEGRPALQIRHAISEGFVVATRRTRTAGKVEIPSLEDHVSKLEHMGKETVRKLQDIQAAGQQVGIEIDIAELNCIQKVGDFRQLSLRAEQDGHLRQRLQHVLKLSREKWEEARDHAMRAVKGDSYMRVWYADRRATEMGLLFACRLGSVELERPVALIQTRVENGETKMEATMIADLVPVQRELVHRMQPQAAHSWWLGGHPGWAIFPVDSEQFMQSGNLSTMSLLDTPSAQYQQPVPMPARDVKPQAMMPNPGAGPMGSQMVRPSNQQQQGVRPMMPPPQGQQWIPGMPMLAGNAAMPGQMMPPPQMMMPPQQQQQYAGRGGSRNPFAEVALSLNNHGGQQQQQQQQQMGPPGAAPRSTSSSGGGGGGVGPSSRASSGGGSLSKRPHEPMLEPSPSGSHEQHRREFVPPPPSSMGPPSHRVTAASVAAAAAATAAQVAAAEAESDSSNPNPFVSFQQHPSPQLAPVMAHLQEGGAPSLDLSALVSLPMDPSMFAHAHHHDLHSAQQHQQQAAAHMQQQQNQQQQQQQMPYHGQMPNQQQQQQQHQGSHAAQAMARAYLNVPAGLGGGLGAGGIKGTPSLGLGAFSSVEFDKVLMDNMEGSLNLGGSLQLPHNFLQGVLSSIPPGAAQHLGAAPGSSGGLEQAVANLAAGGPPEGVTDSPAGGGRVGSGGTLQSQGSALDTMQSIEHALPDLREGSR